MHGPGGNLYSLDEVDELYKAFLHRMSSGRLVVSALGSRSASFELLRAELC